MIHRMFALYEHIPSELIEANFSEHGLRMNPANGEKVIVLDLSMNEDGVSLLDTGIVDYDTDNNTSKFFLRSASGNDSSPFPTIYLDQKGTVGDNNEEAKKSKSYSKLLRILESNVELNGDLRPLLEYLCDNAFVIMQNIKTKMVTGKGATNILTLKINGEFVGQSPFFKPMRDYVKENLLEDFYTCDKKRIVGKNQHCSICNTLQEEVWGYASIYNFYAAKTELAPQPGFRKHKAHNNYPVCPQCAEKLNKLKPIVDKYFKFQFCKMNYFIIPEVIKPNDTETMSAIFQIIRFAREEQTGKSPAMIGGLTIGERKNIVDSQTKEVFDLLAQKGSYANYTMLFYEASNSQFKILMTLESVFPYQFQKVFIAKDETEKHHIFKQQRGFVKDRAIDLEFNFSVIKEFYAFDNKHPAFREYFLDLVRCIFLQKPVSDDQVLDRLMSVIREKSFNHDRFYSQTTLKAYLIILFLLNLELIKSNKNPQEEVPVAGKYDEFFKEHAKFFGDNIPAKKGVFLMGVLCQNLLAIQQQERGSQPFLKKLNGLKLNKDLIVKLYPEILNKLQEYDKNYYADLEETISGLMVETDDLGGLSNNEISFIFVLGMTLSKIFKNKDQSKETTDNDNVEES